MNYDISIYKKLYSIYYPLKTNKNLIADFNNITGNYKSITNIRLKINNLISKNYLNEAVIKSAFVNRVLSKKSPKHNITAFELNTSSSRADLCTINGFSFVYEIKTKYDSFIRLDKQLKDYTMFFDFLYVIVPKEDVSDVLEIIPDYVGVISYELNRLKNITFKYVLEAKHNNNINPFEQLMSLTKKELFDISKTNVDYTITKEHLVNNILLNNSNKQINKIYKETIKEKYFDKWNFLHNNLENIYLLDYQWFFKNNLNYNIVYK